MVKTSTASQPPGWRLAPREAAGLGRRCALGLSLFALFLPPAVALPPTEEAVDGEVEILIARLKSAQKNGEGPEAGSFAGEMPAIHSGGVSALATFALLSAGVPWHDRVITRAVAYLDDHPLPGTYSRALRALVWAHMAERVPEGPDRVKYRRLLQIDIDWLARAMKPDGYYGYDIEGLGGDHSCTQFAVLGMRAADRLAVEVPTGYWEKVYKHWLETQNSDGSWSYAGSAGGTTTMTTAGVNSLYAALSQYFVCREMPYTRLHGVPQSSTQIQARAGVFKIIDRGLSWLAGHDLFERGAYQLFGLERLGVASGFERIGGRDWYRDGVSRVAPSAGNTVDDAMTLLFLVYGRAPLLLNKLSWGGQEDWNRYYRDLHGLTQELSHLHERIYKWQIVAMRSPLHDWLDAPFLWISATNLPELSPAELEKLRLYVDAGGTIIAHAEQASPRFAAVFTRWIEAAFGPRGWKLEPLPRSHPLFNAIYGKGSAEWCADLRIEGMSDGLRTAVYLIPTDIAGAWHQSRFKSFPDLFEIMANLRAVSAPEYESLPQRLRPMELEGPSADPHGYLRILTLSPSSTPLDVSGKWDWTSRQLAHDNGLMLNVVPSSWLFSVGGDPRRWGESFDLLHVTGPGTLDLEPWGGASALAAFVRAGGTIWLEAAGGESAFSRSAEALLDELAGALDGKKELLSPSHPVLSGAVPLGQPLDHPTPGRWGKNVVDDASRVKITALTWKNRVVAIFTPFDVLATQAGHFIYEAPALARKDSQKLLRNLLFSCHHERAGTAGASGPSWVENRDLEPLLKQTRAAVERRDFLTAVLALQPLRAWMSDERVAALFRGFSDQAHEQLRRLQADGPQAQAESLGRLVLALEPRDPAAQRAAPSATAPTETAGPPVGAETGEAGAAGNGNPDLAAIDPAPWEKLPKGLSDIYVEFEGETGDARTLLEGWMKFDREEDNVNGRLANIAAELAELEVRAQAIIRDQARDRRQDNSDQRGGSAFEEIAAERKRLDDQAQEWREKLSRILQWKAKINRSLKPKSEEIEAFGMAFRNRRWIILAEEKRPEAGPQPQTEPRP